MKMKYSQDYIKMIQPSAMHEFMVSVQFIGRVQCRIIEQRYRADNEEHAISLHLTAFPREEGESLKAILVWPIRPKTRKISWSVANQNPGFQYEIPCRISGISCGEDGQPDQYQPNFQYHIPHLLGTIVFDEAGEPQETHGMMKLARSNVQAAINKVKDKWYPWPTRLLSDCPGFENHPHWRFSNYKGGAKRRRARI